MYGDTERGWCFGCGLGGDVLDFVQRTEGVGLPEAIRRLEAGGGCAVRPKATAGQRSATVGFERDPAALTVAARYCTGQLRRRPEAQRYLAARGIGAGAAARLGLGYAPGNGLRSHMESAGFGAERLSRSGLFTARSERFAGMIVVPDATGGLTRWMAGRAIDPGAAHRFQALPGTKPVLGLGRLGAAPPWVVVAEGLFDWITLAGWSRHYIGGLTGTRYVGAPDSTEAHVGIGRWIALFAAACRRAAADAGRFEERVRSL